MRGDTTSNFSGSKRIDWQGGGHGRRACIEQKLEGCGSGEENQEVGYPQLICVGIVHSETTIHNIDDTGLIDLF